MKFKISYLVSIFLIILILHLTGIFTGLYEKNIRIDIPQHILAGVIFGLIWLWWLRTQKKTELSRSLIFISILSFVALGAVTWEILEFAVWKLLPSFANSFKFYSPTVGELLSDLVANLVGGLLVGLWWSGLAVQSK